MGDYEDEKAEAEAIDYGHECEMNELREEFERLSAKQSKQYWAQEAKLKGAIELLKSINIQAIVNGQEGQAAVTKRINDFLETAK